MSKSVLVKINCTSKADWPKFRVDWINVKNHPFMMGRLSFQFNAVLLLSLLKVGGIQLLFGVNIKGGCRVTTRLRDDDGWMVGFIFSTEIIEAME